MEIPFYRATLAAGKETAAGLKTIVMELLPPVLAHPGIVAFTSKS
jgi:hypothetical protein